MLYVLTGFIRYCALGFSAVLVPRLLKHLRSAPDFSDAGIFGARWRNPFGGPVTDEALGSTPEAICLGVPNAEAARQKPFAVLVELYPNLVRH